jgi:hypothetical protein
MSAVTGQNMNLLRSKYSMNNMAALFSEKDVIKNSRV